MLRFFQYIFFGHVHEWETMHENELQGVYGGVGSRIQCRCKKCGAWKKFDLI